MNAGTTGTFSGWRRPYFTGRLHPVLYDERKSNRYPRTATVVKYKEIQYMETVNKLIRAFRPSFFSHPCSRSTFRGILSAFSRTFSDLYRRERTLCFHSQKKTTTQERLLKTFYFLFFSILHYNSEKKNDRYYFIFFLRTSKSFEQSIESQSLFFFFFSFSFIWLSNQNLKSILFLQCIRKTSRNIMVFAAVSGTKIELIKILSFFFFFNLQKFKILLLGNCKR